MWLRNLLRLRGVLVGVIIGLGLAVLLIWKNGDQHIIRKPAASNNEGGDADVDTTLLAAPVQNQIADEKPATSQYKQTDALEDETKPESDLHKAYSHVKTILFFIGYPRSRHSLLGSLLDAHPHMVVSDETMAFSRWKRKSDYWAKGLIYEFYDTMFMASQRALAHGRRSHAFNDTVVNKSSAFGYYVPDQWQGTFDGYIEVIGDKSGAFTAGAMMKENSIEEVHLLEKASGAKVKFVHVVRNPFDNIATQTLQHRQIKARNGDHEVKIDAPDIIDEKMGEYFHWAEGSNKARESFPGSVIDIPSMDIVKQPAVTLRKICAFLEITCTEEYIQACAATVDPVPSITRNFVEWTEEQKKKVYEQMKRFPFFEGYSFDKY